MDKGKSLSLKFLKVILWTYIVMCIIIAGLNYGYVDKASAETAKLIETAWHIYENWVKTAFIIVGSILTLNIVGKSGRATMRKMNLIGLTVSAFAVHIFTPILLDNSEVYFFTMPLPWTTTPIQLLDTGSSFYLSRAPVWGVAGISAVLGFYIVWSLIVFAGTVLLGRRWQCSTICLFNGFASEVFGPATPLVGRRKKAKPWMISVFKVARWIFLLIAVGITLWWVLYLSGIDILGSPQTMGTIENYKYLSAELLMAMFFWIAFTGRGYCYYCPLGTVLSFLGRASGQHIGTDSTKCIECGKCNRTCPMTIDIRKKARDKTPVLDSRCVGCGHCVDSCPTETLYYSTHFLNWTRVKTSRARKSR